jgi:hypothetical protein
MSEIAIASLNTLPYPAVSPADSLVLNQLLAELQTLRSEVAQLREETQDLIKEAIQPLQDEVSDLKAKWLARKRRSQPWKPHKTTRQKMS